MSIEGRREKKSLMRTVKEFRITPTGVIAFLLIADVLLLIYRIIEDLFI